MSDPRVNPKWGPLPDSLVDPTKREKKRKCEECGRTTTGAFVSPVQRLEMDGSLKPTARFLCADCDPTSSTHRKARQAAYQREIDNGVRRR